MKKIYLLLLVGSTLILNAYVVENHSFLDNTLVTNSKITQIYPNPATSYINFSFDNSVNNSYRLQVYNFIGRKMNDTRIADSKLTINLDDNYFRGIYIYQLRDQSGRVVESGKFQVSK